MANKSKFLNTTVGRKVLMGVTGLFLCSFLIVHLAGNLALFAHDDGRSFNEYTKFMSTNGLIRLMEIVLVAGFLAHIILAVRLTTKNTSARPVKYAVNRQSEVSSIFSRNMGITGTIILAFLVLHLKTFWFEYKFGEVPMDTWGNKNMQTVVMAAFDQWWYSAIYVVSMILLGAHLNHGFQSAFRSIGLNNKKYAPAIYKTGAAFAIIMTIGFAAFPIIFYFNLFGYN